MSIFHKDPKVAKKKESTIAVDAGEESGELIETPEVASQDVISTPENLRNTADKPVERRILRQPVSVGRTVHFQHPNGKTVAAIVTDVPEQTHDNQEVELCLLMSSGISFLNAHYADEPTTNSWSWPPRV